ncbi:hypothetical protein CMI47_02015 [Candidatus Pacearchaeota archaeon]|nr:hypothetical protein [Candidatus Pacearchaeota archaeon]|tara:strand:- start:5294 stop:6076 length:783 start_codon:yes stop_codon:yes gene_type:complete
MFFYRNDLRNQLKYLKNNFNILGLKSSFEDEGCMIDEMFSTRSLTHQCGIDFSIKIGGCEAKTDVMNSAILEANAIVAPMIESEFALQKWSETVSFFQNKNILNSCRFFINIESKCAYENIQNIINSAYTNTLSGIVVGRSDFARSFGMTKKEVNTDFIFDKTKFVLECAKSKDLITCIGGTISVDSSIFINKLYDLGLLDRIETRNVIIELNDNNIKNISSGIEAALLFEKTWLKSKEEYQSILKDVCSSRIKAIGNRK